jgi:carbamoyltransferase
MKILGAWSGHDCSYSIIDEGQPVVHDEYERFIREKEPAGDSLGFFLENYPDLLDEISHVATCFPSSKLTHYSESYNKVMSSVESRGGSIFTIGHHKAHAANAFFSSNLEEATIVTIDGGGVEENNVTTACTIWLGKDNKITHLHTFPMSFINIGGVWTRTTRYIFQLQSGWPRGHQAGSVMAMGTLGDPKRFHDDFLKMLTSDIAIASHKPAGQPRGALIPGKDPEHPYLNKWKLIADKGESEKFDLAAGLQSATETVLRSVLGQLISQIPTKNLCLSGGVSLNCVAIGKIKSWFPDIQNVYITPTPHDGGLPIGASQYVWHNILEKPRINWNDNFTPYLGRKYSESEVIDAISKRSQEIDNKKSNIKELVSLLDSQKIVSVFGGGSESGRRALGNRSILADPRSPSMKSMINEKVKHRQWYRPFAPSILREDVSSWFETDQSSPYMSFAIRFQEDKMEKVPAVIHEDGTARLQTVTKNDNKWYYNLLSEWKKKTKVPILLNTSFNDREPICENPDHAIDCFLRTNIDYLYFSDYDILVSKK